VDLSRNPATLAGDRHREIFSTFLTDLDLVGNDVNDAWLAALAIEHRATLVSNDEGFARFPGHAWINPADPR
jgi:predicted nucleic acid-binding protein